ncbi:phage tail protein [Salmonella enterica]
MMMVYGMFVFELKTLPHQQLQQNKTWRHVKNERINRSASWQYIGAGDDQITLSGVLYPEITGGEVSLSVLTTQAYTGRPWPLIDGVGQIYGMYVITGLKTTRSELDRYGKAKKIEFSISFQRCDEDLRERLQSSSVSDLLNGLKDKASTAYDAVNGVISGRL